MAKRSGKSAGMPARNPSIESSSSQTTIQAPRLTRRPSLEQQLISFTGVTTYGQYLFDTCCAIIYCSTHHNILLSSMPKNKFWFLPFFPLRQTDSWTSAIEAKLKLILQTSTREILPCGKPELAHIFRLQVPNACKFLHRATFYTTLSHDKDPNMNCCKEMINGKWTPASELITMVNTELWGPEPYVFGQHCIDNTVEKGAYTEYTMRDAMRYLPREPPKTFQDELLKSAGFSEKDITRVYAEYIQHAYPSQYFVFPSFYNFMMTLGWTANDMELTNVYRAFCFNRNDYMSFHEFLLGIAAMDKSTSHGGHPGELRCGYISRYYDTDVDGFLQRNDLKMICYDMLRLKTKPSNNEAVEIEVQKGYESLGIAQNEPIPVTSLMTAIGSMAFRGTSILFRSSFSVLKQLNLKRIYDSLSQLQSGTALDAGLGSRKPKGTCIRCRAKRYNLATHCVRIAVDGSIVEPTELPFDDTAVGSSQKRTLSQSSFSGETIGNRMLDWIRDFASSSNLLSKGFRALLFKSNKGHNAWLNTDRGQLAAVIIKLCEDAISIFKRESRCIKITSPCYVFGDIHGNLRDLLVYERSLWQKGPICLPDSMLFLGDYVDRGDHGLECVVYLLSCKVLNPDKFFMLRGNHELRPIQMVFTFHKECMEKFSKYGQQVWEACNKVFDSLPLCAVVDENVFCAHGGIPTSMNKIEELQSISCPLPDPENQSPAAWEMLWNDPISGNEFGEYAEMLRLQGGSNAFSNIQGFLPNTKRGTAYYFSDEAVQKFLSANGLSYILRGHEVIPAGFNFHMNGRVITVFSSSKYCNGANEAASVLIDGEKLRIIRLETTI